MTDNSGYYVKSATRDVEKYQEIRRIFGERAEGILQKCGTIAYDYLYLNMKNNYCNATYINNDELFRKLKDNVLNDRPEDLVPYTHDSHSRTFDWKQRTDEVKAATAKYNNFHAKEVAAEKQKAVDPKLKAFLSRTIGSDALAGALTAKYGEKAYAVALSAVMEPGNMVTDLGVKIDGKFSSKNLLATLAKDETRLDQAKLDSFLDNYSTRKAEASAKKEKADEAYGMKAPANGVENDEPSLSVMLDEMVVTGKAPKKTKPIFGVSRPEAPDLAPIKIAPQKTPAELKYDELLAKKRKKSGDENAYLTCGDLLDAGVDIQKDFRPALSILAINHTDFPKDLYASFADRDAAITKDVATAALTVMQARKKDRKLYAELRDMAKQPTDSRASDDNQLRIDLKRQKELAEAQRRTNDHFSPHNESNDRIDAVVAARKTKDKETPSKEVNLTMVKQQKERG